MAERSHLVGELGCAEKGWMVLPDARRHGEPSEELRGGSFGDSGNEGRS